VLNASISNQGALCSSWASYDHCAFQHCNRERSQFAVCRMCWTGRG